MVTELMTSRVPFYFVDVFATRPLTGNPLSLVPDADGLNEAQMRAIAREFNQSETTFLLRPSLPGATVRLRSFTPAGAEVGGAGHNALGAWPWLEEAGRLASAAGPLASRLVTAGRSLTSPRSSSSKGMHWDGPAGLPSRSGGSASASAVLTWSWPKEH